MIKICKLETCPNRAILDYCREHDSLNPKKVKLPKKRSPIAKESEKEKVRKQAYRKLKIEMMQESNRCEIKAEGCLGIADQLHHGKGRIGSLLLDRQWIKRTCDPCHKWAELNSLAAKEAGVSFSRLNKAS